MAPARSKKVLAALLCVAIAISYGAVRASQGGAVPPPSDIEVFIAGWCGHCRDFAPELEALRRQAAAAGAALTVHDADDPGSAAIMRARGVKSFPTVLLRGEQYEGDRTAAAILAALEK